MPKLPRVEVTVAVSQGVRIAHAISLGIYLVSAITVTSILAGVVLQLAFTGPTQAAVSPNPSNSVTLTWTAPGDDAGVGTAATYDLRYAVNELSEATWGTATSVASPPTPLSAGSTQSAIVTGLTPGTLYAFAIKTTDEAGNESAISNIAVKRTEVVTCTPTWSCTEWSVCQGGTQVRSCIDVAAPACGTDFGRPIEQQTCTMPTPTPAPEPPPTCQERWSCSSWTACVNGNRTRVCQDLNRCGTETQLPATTFDCAAGGEPPANPNPVYLAVVKAKGGDAAVRVYNGTTGKLSKTFAAYKSYRSGLSVAGGDVDGDGALDILATPAGNSSTLVRGFRYNPATSQFIRWLDFSALDSKFRGGANLTVADLDRDGLAEVIVSPVGRGQSSRVEIYEWNLGTKRMELRASFRPYGTKYRDGIQTTAADVNGDGQLEVVTAPAPGKAEIRVFTYVDGKTSLLGKFMAASSSFRGGVDLASLDVDLDGRDDIITATYSDGLPGVRVFSRDYRTGKFVRAKSPFATYVAATSFTKGVRIGAF